MNKFEKIAVGHGRLLYKEAQQKDLGQWFEYMTKLSSYVEHHHRLHLATSNCYIYFFDLEDKEQKVWFAREIIGHEPRLPEELLVFDRYAGEAYSVDCSQAVLETPLSLVDALRSSIPMEKSVSLSKTCCVRIGAFDLNVFSKEERDHLKLKISFQFFKNN